MTEPTRDELRAAAARLADEVLALRQGRAEAEKEQRIMPKVESWAQAVTVIAISAMCLAVAVWLIAAGKGAGLEGPLVTVLAGVFAAAYAHAKGKGELPSSFPKDAVVVVKNGKVTSMRPPAPSLQDIAVDVTEGSIQPPSVKP